MLANVIELASGAVLAAITRSPWALVAAMLAGTAARTMWSYRYRGFTPRLVFSWSEVHPLVRFGKWRFVSNMLYYLCVRVDDLLVARYLGRRPLGNYRIAYRLAHLPTTEIVTVLERVAFPALAARARESPALAIATYPRYLMLTCGVAGPVAAVFAALAEPTVAALLGPAYAAAAAPLVILCLAGYLRAVVSTSGSLVLSLGRPQLDALMGTARALVLVVGIIALAPHGVVGAAVASLMSLLVTVPVWLFSLWRVDAHPWHAVQIAIGRLPVAICAGGAAYVVAQLPWGPLPRVVAGTIAGAVGRAVAITLFDRPLGRELAVILRRARRKAGSPRRTETVRDVVTP